MEAGAGDGADGGHIQVKHHVLDEVGVIEILVLEPLGGQLGVSLPAVGVGLGHPVVADVGEDDDLVLVVQAQHADQLADGAVGHAAVVHGTVQGLPGYLKDAVLPVQIREVLEPLLVLLQLGELDIIGHRFSHNAYLQISFDIRIGLIFHFQKSTTAISTASSPASRLTSTLIMNCWK